MTNDEESSEIYDLFVIGGGINGAGIARDATGRGYRVALAEMNDFASATSSASTKLFHGGLRYLEFFEFGLVRKALIEREVLLRAMPHVSWPMRFVLPVHGEMRFDADTPTSRLLARMMPWKRGQRPLWLIRLGLFLYDHLGGRQILPATRSLHLRTGPEGAPLQEKYTRAFEYSDCWVEDSRLTLLNVLDAAAKGADVFPRTRVSSARQEGGHWVLTLETAEGHTRHCRARMIVNAGGPWVENVVKSVARSNTKEAVRLVRGSHIVTKRLYAHDKCYFLQGTDGRIMFAIPYEEDFTLIGTTDCPHPDLAAKPTCTDAEIDYILDFANTYFAGELSRDDVVWTYSGVRPLYDDGASSATAATRDYVLTLDRSAGAPMLSVFGGKITTYRKLAEEALTQVDEALEQATLPWTAHARLPGGDFDLSERDALVGKLGAQMPFLDAFTIRRLFRQYGSECFTIFAGVERIEQLGRAFGNQVFAREIDWAIEAEWVRTAEDFLWRRSKLGLRFSRDEAEALDSYIRARVKRSDAAPSVLA
ncbi:MAG: glycerol-3-phosphate dehydrogenase [Pseudomonadota bacterium]